MAVDHAHRPRPPGVLARLLRDRPAWEWSVWARRPAGAMRRTRTALPRVSPDHAAHEFVVRATGCARKRRAPGRTGSAVARLPRERLHPRSAPTPTRRDGRTQAAGSATPSGPGQRTTMRTIRLRPSLTASLVRVCRTSCLPQLFARPVPIDRSRLVGEQGGRAAFWCAPPGAPGAQNRRISEMVGSLAGGECSAGGHWNRH